jgi:hypothetical protein
LVTGADINEFILKGVVLDVLPPEPSQQLVSWWSVGEGL